MDKLTVGQLKEQLQNYIDILDDYDDDDVVETVSNTYFVHSQFFMQFGRKGFVDLGNIYNIIEPDEDKEDDKEELFEQCNAQQTEGGKND